MMAIIRASDRSVNTCIGYVGDNTKFFINPAGFVYESDGSREILWIVPVNLVGKVVCFKIKVAKSPEAEWWYPRLGELPSPLDRLKYMASGSPRELCGLYVYLIEHFGATFFDQKPTVMTIKEAVSVYSHELALLSPLDMKPAFAPLTKDI